MDSFVKVFMIRTKLFFESATFRFTLGSTLQKGVYFKNVINFLLMETNATLIIHFVKNVPKTTP
jgi:hypothetical protein